MIRSAEPNRTKNLEMSKGAELKTAASRALGTGTLRLLDVFPSPDEHKGRKMEVKGLYLRVPSDGINVTSLQVVGDACAP